MDVLLVNAIVYIITFCFYYKRRGKFDIYTLIWAAFAFTAIMGYLCVILGYHYSHDKHLGFKISLIPYICIYLSVFIISFPFKHFDSRKINYSLLIDRQFAKIVSPLLLLSIVLICTKGYQTLMVMALGGFGEAYQEAFETGGQIFEYSNIALRRINDWGYTIYSIFEPLLLAYFFFNQSKKKNKTWINMVGILVCLMPELLVILSRGSKGGLFFLVMSLLFYYILFKERLGIKAKRKLMIIGIGFFLGLAVLAFSITTMRNDMKKSNTTQIETMVRYLGESMPNVGWQYYDKVDRHPYGARFFPELLYSKKISDSRDNRFFYWSNYTGVNTAQLNTIWGDCYVEFGLFGSFAFICFTTIVWYLFVFERYSNVFVFPLVYYYYSYFVVFGLFSFGFIGERIHVKFMYYVFICLGLYLYFNKKGSKRER